MAIVLVQRLHLLAPTMKTKDKDHMRRWAIMSGLLMFGAAAIACPEGEREEPLEDEEIIEEEVIPMQEREQTQPMQPRSGEERQQGLGEEDEY